MKKTALLKLGHVEMMDGNLDKQDICIELTSPNIQVYTFVKTLTFRVQLLLSVYDCFEAVHAECYIE